MDVDKTDVEWLIMLLVMLWPDIRKLLEPKKKAPVQRRRGKRKR